MQYIHMLNAGNIGNRMFQYMFCRMLQIRLSRTRLVGFDLPMWGLKSEVKSTFSNHVLTIKGGHVFDLRQIMSWFADFDDACLEFGGYAQRLEYLGSPDLMSAFFPPTPKPQKSQSEKDLIVNVRGKEIWNPGLHPDYIPLPISFIESVVRSCPNLNPVFVGQLDDDRYSGELRRRFSGAEFVAHNSPIDDFSMLYHATHLLVSVSTFSWLGGWLSPHTRVVHQPLLGLFNPEQRPDIDLCPRGDERFVFYPFAVRRWTASQDDVDFVMG